MRIRPFSERERPLLAQQQQQQQQQQQHSHDDNTTTTTLIPRGAGGGLRKIVSVLDDRVLVFDPPESSELASLHHRATQPSSTSSSTSASSLLPFTQGKKVKDIRFCFDRVFDEHATQQDVYDGTARHLVDGVLDGFNSTVFAYGVRLSHILSLAAVLPMLIFKMG